MGNLNGGLKGFCTGTLNVVFKWDFNGDSQWGF